MTDPEIDAIRRQLDAIESRAKPLAKVREPRDEHRSNVHASYRAAVDKLTELGWSMSAIARKIGCDTVTLIDWYNEGASRRNQWPGWVFAALPTEARAAFMRVSLGWVDSVPESKRNGTSG